MAKFIAIHHRQPRDVEQEKERLRAIGALLQPDNLRADAIHEVFSDDRSSLAVLNRPPGYEVHRSALLLGVLYQNSSDWSQVGAQAPDGSYAICRSDDAIVEVLTDTVASRTVWYYSDQDLFICSSSQRAIIAYLGRFSFDERVIPWFLSAGCPGPSLAWDSRLKRMPGEAVLRLDKTAWSLDLRVKSVEFVEQARPDMEHERLLSQAICETMTHVGRLDFNEWTLPLSGGYDSRGILCHLLASGSSRDSIRTITWGLEQSQAEEGNDALVAARLASAVGVPHSFYKTDFSNEGVSVILDRFLRTSEGMSDHLAGYLDGMSIWADLHGKGIAGIIRGDEGFGWTPVTNDYSVRRSVGLLLCSDFSDLRDVALRFGLPGQAMDPELERRKETAEQWRDRLYHGFRLPVVLAAVSDVKYSYVEVCNPLLSRGILEIVRGLPDRLRTDKRLFRDIVDRVSPPVPYADKGANAGSETVVSDAAITEVVTGDLTSMQANRLLGGDLSGYLAGKIRGGQNRELAASTRNRKLLGRFLPRTLKDHLRRKVLPTLGGNRMAFRASLLVRTIAMFEHDADACGQPRS